MARTTRKSSTLLALTASGVSGTRVNAQKENELSSRLVETHLGFDRVVGVAELTLSMDEHRRLRPRLHSGKGAGDRRSPILEGDQ